LTERFTGYAAVGVSKGTDTLYLNGFGSANLDYAVPITTNSPFDIASVSKQLTAAGIALLTMNGQLLGSSFPILEVCGPALANLISFR
jgi:CubicO group peptidase (beta-lactamase class C family)